MVDIVRSCLDSRTLLQLSWSHHLPLHPDGRLTLGDVEGPSGVVLALRCIVTPSRIRYGPIDVVLDSLPDQCAKDHTSTEMPVSHATYDKPKVLDFRVVQMWRRPMQLPAKKTPTLNRAPRRNRNDRSRLIRPVACFLGASTDSVTCRLARPAVPFRLAFHCPGLVRDIPEHWSPAQ